MRSARESAAPRGQYGGTRLSSHSYREAVTGGKSLLLQYRRKSYPPVGMEATELEEIGGSKRKSEETRSADQTQPVSVIKLFRYATCLDYIFMLLGTLAAFLHGACFPVAMFIFGDITNAFINREATNTPLDIAPCPQDPPQSGTLFIPDFTAEFNATPPDCDAVYSYIDPITNGTCSDFGLQDILSLAIGSKAMCLTDDLFIQEIDTLVFIFIGIGVAAFIFGIFQIWFFRLATERQLFRIRLLYYGALLHQELGWFESRPTGNVTSYLSNGVGIIHESIGDNISILIQWISTFLVAIVIGLIREYRLALLLVAVIPFIALFGYLIGKVGGFFSRLEQDWYAQAGAVAQEVLSSIKTVQAFGGESREQARYDGFLKGSRKYGVYKGMAVGFSAGSIYFLTFLIYSISFWFGGYLVSEELSQVGDVITVFFAILIGAFYLGQTGPNFQKIAEALGVAGAIYGLIDRTPAIDSSDNVGTVPENFEPTIEFKDVDFSYPLRPDSKVLKGLSLKVCAGEKLALVGASGSGKSSVIKMIQRLYDVESGEVLMGGINVKDLNLKWLRSQIGVVSQEPVLFDTTIAENIRYGREEATLDDIMEAAKNANAHEFITSLPKGYDTNVGEGGTQLSGGQKQRVAIARALVRNPKILLLDEATSALDTKSERLVQDALDNASQGRTTIIIAHRLSTIKNAHYIASLDHGSVREVGTHAELIANNGIYYDLVTAQSFVTPQGNRNLLKRSLTALGSPHKKRLRRASEISDPDSFSQTSFFRQLRKASTTSVDTTYVIVGKPTPLIKVPPKFIRLIRLNYRSLPVNLLGCLAAALNGLVFPSFAIIFGEVLEVFSRPPDEILSGVHPWAAAFLAIGIFSALATFLKFVCFNITGTSMSQVVRSILFRALLRQDLGWHDLEENSASTLTTRLAVDAGLVQGLVGIRVGSLLEATVALLFSLAVAFAYSWLTALVILLFMPVMIIASAIHFSVVAGSDSSNLKAVSDSTELAVGSIENIQTVITFGLEDRYYREFVKLVTPSYRRALCLSGVSGVTYAFSQAILLFSYIITFRFGAFQVTLPSDSVAFASFSNVYRVFAAIVFGAIGIASVTTFVPDAKVADQAAKDIFAIIDRESSIDGTSEEGVKPETFGSMRLKNVFFAYPSRPDTMVLKNLSSVAHAQERVTVALVGASGSGKSTVLALLARFYDPTSGVVSLDGCDCKDLNVKWLRSHMAIVSQEPVLFNASIAENIRYGALFKELSDEDVVRAAKAANIHSFIETLPLGYDTNVGAKGTQLSGGQKQRIAIARALVRDPKVLLLDEATSALDTESEKVVQEALDKAREGRTTVVIAHRLSTIQNADIIVVLENGSLAELGTHAELLSHPGGLYYKMVYCHHKAWREDSDHRHLKTPELTTSTTL